MTESRAASVLPPALVRMVVPHLESHAEPVQLEAGQALPRQAFDLIVTGAQPSGANDALGELVSLRNSLTRDGALLLIAHADRRAELASLASTAGFTQVRDVGVAGATLITLELKR